MKYINLFWYRNKTNVGDMASYYIVSHLSSYKIRYKNPKIRLLSAIKNSVLSLLKGEWQFQEILQKVYPWEKCMMAVGSILANSRNNIVVWGSGFKENNDVFRGGDVRAVRGYLSRAMLPAEFANVPIGDPALLLPLIIDGKYGTGKKSVSQLEKVAMIPHYYDYDAIALKLKGNIDIIDVRTGDVESFVKNIRKYDCILSSSLHGIIISHSFGIPALWVKYGDIGSGPFKFYDYFSSVGIEQYDGFDYIDKLVSNNIDWKNLFIENWCYALPKVDIKILSDNLLDSFPLKSYK